MVQSALYRKRLAKRGKAGDVSTGIWVEVHPGKIFNQKGGFQKITRVIILNNNLIASGYTYSIIIAVFTNIILNYHTKWMLATWTSLVMTNVNQQSG